MAGTVLYAREGRIATITYNRPEALNAINGELREDLDAAWATFRDDEEAWVAIVTGAGRAFSAGPDLRGSAQPRGATHWETPSLTHRVFDLTELPPTRDRLKAWTPRHFGGCTALVAETIDNARKSSRNGP
ncbi:MAG TPA: enoyl-CoA hydratase-related protein [Tepidiformaceae bacterium]|nr:enoyl-CoA hydratase-related protein [Tepidiformaceae bacterium]